ncbi:DNA replication protein [Ruminococcus sp. SR1/5]|nr:DNA replication protein [Ruminococcus sp. SR1/5]
MKYEYMKESEQMLQYFQFPKFLLKLRISQTAKFLYMILYDRARISRKNNWIDKYGNVYLIFPIEELSVQIGKCKSSVKTALKELDDVGLVFRKSGGFSKPNHLYVRIPSDADISDAVMHRAKNYVENWDEMKRNHIGCLFWGPVGTGKSFIAGCIANELLKQEVTVKMTNFNTIIDDIFPLADKTEYINALASYQLLVIDDLGVERNSEYALGTVFSVIDRRVRSGRPLIITTNLPLKEIKTRP